jgi:hypothetical protein
MQLLSCEAHHLGRGTRMSQLSCMQNRGDPRLEVCVFAEFVSNALDPSVLSKSKCDDTLMCDNAQYVPTKIRKMFVVLDQIAV